VEVINGPRAKWFIALIASALLFNAVNGMATGSATVFYRPVKRSEDPVLFWTAVLVSAALAIACFLTLVL
jgi:hypothetical protein